MNMKHRLEKVALLFYVPWRCFYVAAHNSWRHTNSFKVSETLSASSVEFLPKARHIKSDSMVFDMKGDVLHWEHGLPLRKQTVLL